MRSLAENVEKFWCQLLLDWRGATPTYITVNSTLLQSSSAAAGPSHRFFLLHRTRFQAGKRNCAREVLLGNPVLPFFGNAQPKKQCFFCWTRRDFSTKTKMERKDFLEKQLRCTEQFPVCWDAPLELSQLFANVLFLPPMCKWNMCQLLTNFVTSSDWQCYTKKLNEDPSGKHCSC